MKDIQNILQTSQYNRLRFGVGSEFNKGRQVDYVLGKWSDDELTQLTERLEICSAIIESFILAGPKPTMNQFNGS
jgi:PTH1 family peptidyl-tRNA hydrolase